MAHKDIDRISKQESGLKRQLSTAQLGMIAIGGAIGTGLFLGSGFAISLAGPAVIVSYVLSGVIALLMMGCLSEMTVSQPTAGSFGVYAEEYLHPFLGFTMRYSYWAGTVVGIGTEVTATGIYMSRWFPQVDSMVWIIVFAAAIFYVNVTSVGSFGRFEFVFASIKVVAIVAFIIVGLIVIFGHADPSITVANYTNDQGFAPFGIGGILLGAFIAIFSYLSMEMIAVTAGEAKDPEKAVPRALKSTILRLFLFYILSIGIMLVMVPWSRAGAKTIDASPFVTALSMVHIPFAADIMNFVVLTAALSSMNAMFYITSRMIFSLSRGGYAPKVFGKLSRSGVPVNGLIISSAGIFVAALVNQLIQGGGSQWISMMGMSMFGPLFTWTVIMVTHLAFRKKWDASGGRKLPVRMPFYPYSTWLGIILIGIVVVYSCVTTFQTTLYTGLPWFAFLTIIYLVWFRKKQNTEIPDDDIAQ